MGPSAGRDIVQEVFVKLAASDLPANIRPWLYAAVRNRCLNQLRKQKRTGQLLERLALENRIAYFQPDDKTTESLAEPVQNALNTLPSELREIVVMKIWGKLTFDDIARITSVPSSTAHNRYKKALNLLKSELNDLWQDEIMQA